MESNYGVWVKCSERLPGYETPVKWRDGNDHSHTTDRKIPLIDMAKPFLVNWEWLDESGTESLEDAVNDFLNWLYENSITRHSNGHWYKWDNGHAKEVYYADGIGHIHELFKLSTPTP